ncbi:MAG: DNA-3-methyladenine glycosylase I [Eubacteriales bacterium]|nr:DNA-3-methyladenine glycosylase I [Eubacteriales bacterium]
MPKSDRCAWAREGPLRDYHDAEWGRPEHDDAKLYELLLLEAFQAGLSWLVILKKREAFRAAFDGFDPVRVAAYGPEKIDALMQDAGIVRCRRKLEAAVGNAKVFLAIQKEFGSFDRYLWSFTDGRVIRNETDEFPTRTELSDRVSKDLIKRGMRYMGSVTVYSYLQAIGVVNDHELTCRMRDPEATL